MTQPANRTPTIEARRQLVDELLATRLPQRAANGGREHEDTAEWKEISNQMQSLLRIRNRIAHQPMGPRMEWDSLDENDQPQRRGFWFAIAASQHEAARKDQAVPPLEKEDLRQHIEDVLALKERLAHFYIRRLPEHAPALP